MSGYTAESTLVQQPDGAHLDLATALGVTPSGRVENPVFFTGFLARPDVAAAGLLAVADVAGSRYADAGLMSRLASLDPVVTAGGDRLRFESFSACNGVYARFDLDRDGLGSGKVGFGTTNVDINLPLRTALSRVHRDEALHLSVGRDELRATSLAESHVERKVKLPDRWVRGFAEVPALSAAVEPRGSLTGPAVARFLGGLPRVAPPGPTVHLVPAGHTLRTSRLPGPTTIPLAGAARLRGSDRLTRFATRLTIHTGPSGITAWVFEVPGGRFTLLVSRDPFHGFSGEGTLLELLARPEAESRGRELMAALEWQPSIDLADLAARTGLDHESVRSGLAWLAATGRLGYDIAERAYFHRELPVDGDKVLRRNPRLVAARKLVAEGAVEADTDGWTVRGSHGAHYRIQDAVPLRCSCAWEREHAGARGPCKHLLAVLLTTR